MGELITFKPPRGLRSARPPVAPGRGEILFFTGVRREIMREAALLCAPQKDGLKPSGKGRRKDLS